MKDTRVELDTRIELVTNRMEFLDKEFKRIHREHDGYHRELDALLSLRAIYKEIPCDPIDEERTSLFPATAPTPAPNAPKVKAPRRKHGEIQETYLKVLREFGECTTEDIATLLGEDTIKVSKDLSYLKKKGFITCHGLGQKNYWFV